MLQFTFDEWRAIYAQSDPVGTVAWLAYLLDHGQFAEVPFQLTPPDPWLDRLRQRAWRKSAWRRRAAAHEDHRRRAFEPYPLRRQSYPGIAQFVRRQTQAARDAQGTIRDRVAKGLPCHVRTMAIAADLPQRAVWLLRLHTPESGGYVAPERVREFFERVGVPA